MKSITISDDVVFKKIEGLDKYVVMIISADSSEDIFEMEDEAYDIWNFIIGNKSIRDLISYVQSTYETDESTEDYVKDFITNLENHKLVIVD